MPPKRKSSGDDKSSGDAKKAKHTSAEKASKNSTKEKNGSTERAEKKTYTKKIVEVEENGQNIEFTEEVPTKNDKGQLVFKDWPDFRPNMTPKEVLQAGSFGGTYFRPIKSSITGKSYKDEMWKELPKDWLEGLNIPKMVSSSTYREAVNTYKAKCGGSLQMWEESGWINSQDPYGWFQWYCRFYQGRRTGDDERQVGRWLRCAGKTGRWRNNLISKCVKGGAAYDNLGVSPVVRQTLQHWAYKLNKEDFEAHAKKVRKQLGK